MPTETVVERKMTTEPPKSFLRLGGVRFRSIPVLTEKGRFGGTAAKPCCVQVFVGCVLLPPRYPLREPGR